MVVYKCSRCLKEFSKKDRYNSHLNRKFPCTISEDVSRPTLDSRHRSEETERVFEEILNLVTQIEPGVNVVLSLPGPGPDHDGVLITGNIREDGWVSEVGRLWTVFNKDNFTEYLPSYEYKGPDNLQTRVKKLQECMKKDFRQMLEDLFEREGIDFWTWYIRETVLESICPTRPGTPPKIVFPQK